MNKVSSIIQIKKNSGKKYGNLESKGIEKYEEMIDLQRCIIEELYIGTDAYLREKNFPVSEFVLDDKSARDFLSSDLCEALEGGEEALTISYIAHIDGVEYRTLAYVEVDGENLEFFINLYKKSDCEWLIYTNDNTWETGPGENFFLTDCNKL